MNQIQYHAALMASKNATCSQQWLKTEAAHVLGKQWQAVVGNKSSQWADSKQLVCKLVLIIIILHLTVLIITVAGNLKPPRQLITS